MGKVHYEADGSLSAAAFIGALTDFGPDRPDRWPNRDLKYYELHELGDTWADVTEGTDVLGGVWARERYDWSQPGIVTLTLQEAIDFRPGTLITYRATDRADGGCHVAVDFQRIAASLRGRIVGLGLQVGGARRFRSDLEVTLARLASEVTP